MTSSFFDKIKNEMNKTQEPDKSILKSLKEIGDQKLVNPPTEQKETQTETEQKEPEKQKCPTCDGAFKHLSKHKCKGKEEQEPKEEPGYSVYINCIITKSSDTVMIDLEDFLKPVTDAIEKENQVEHWSFVEYGKGGGMLARRVEQFLKTEQPVGQVYVNYTTKEATACLPVLKKYAKNVSIGLSR